MKRVLLVVTAFAALACSAAAWSQGNRPNQPGRPQSGGQFGGGRMMMSCPAMAVRPPSAFMVDRLAATLGLTKDQTAQLKKITADNDKKISALQQTAAKATQALRAAVLATKYDAKNVKALALKADKAESAVINASIDAWTQIRAILTAKQSAGLEKAMEARRFAPNGPPPAPPGQPGK